MTRLSLIAAILVIVNSLHSQSESLGDWILKMNIGIEQHDKRLFDFTAHLKEKILRDYAGEQWGTYHFGLEVQRRIIHKGRIDLYGGFGLGYENATFSRPFEPGYLIDGYHPLILLMQNRYRKVKAPINISSFIRLNNNLYVSTDFRISWLVFRSVTHTSLSWQSFPYTESTFFLEDMNLRFGLAYRVGNLFIGLNSRIINLQKIDKVLFNEILEDPRVDEKWEWYNPLMFDLTVGYTW